MENPALQVVGCASDGSEAVLKSAELHPDLILMDVNLPQLSGIKAAARIRGLSPGSKILFISQEVDFDVALAALDAGGVGYVVKSDAENELLTAVEAVTSGKTFISALLASCDFSGVLGSHTPLRARTEESIELPTRRLMRDTTSGPSHEVEFYADAESFLIRSARFVGAALANGDAVIVIMNPSHHDSLRQKLDSEGCDVAGAIEQGRYCALEPSDVLSTSLVNDQLDTDRFIKAAGDFIATALKAATGKHPRLAVCGECDALLHAEGEVLFLEFYHYGA
jgi:CheY-like chemotaxis protein